MRSAIASTATALLLLSQLVYARVPPPTITFLNRHGAPRGTTTRLIVIGTNLTAADRVLFDDPAITAVIVNARDWTAVNTEPTRKIELGIDVHVAPGVTLGTHTFRVRTPLGSTDLQTIAIGDTTEVTEREPNDTPTDAQSLEWPVTVNGRMQEPGDVDCYRIALSAGQRVAIMIDAASLGSRMDSVLELRDDTDIVVARNDDGAWNTRDSRLEFEATRTGNYTLQVSDRNGAGNQGRGNAFFYRLTIASQPFTTNVVPLDTRNADPIPPPSSHIATITEHDQQTRRAQGQLVPIPATIRGRIERRADGTSADTFRFHASKGQRLVLAVVAEQRHSPLDAIVTVLDSHGRPNPRAVVQAVWSTNVEVGDVDSASGGYQITSAAGLRPGDFVMIDHEVMQVRRLPSGPGLSMELNSFRGRRYSFLGTSGVAHAVGSPVYKVEVHPPGVRVSPNGLPQIELFYQNDDGGPGYGKDPYLEFTAPADGEYLIRIADARGEAGREYTYELTIAPPRPDFTLSLQQTNLNVSHDIHLPCVVSAYRHDGFNGPIDVRVIDLPAGFNASTGTILPDETEVSLTLSADQVAPGISTPIEVVGEAIINGKRVTRHATLNHLIPTVTATRLPRDIQRLTVSPSSIELQPGGRAQLHVEIERSPDFKERVNLDLRNLPVALAVPNVGTAGIVIPTDRRDLDFTIQADPTTTPLEQTLYVTTGDLASLPIHLRVVLPTPPADPSDASRLRPHKY